MNIEYSEEQKNIIYSEHSKINVDARPGTGKTTTLIGLSEENFDKSILYIVFSKDLRKKSRYSFPINTEVHTINSFAFTYMKEKILNRVIVDEFKVIDIFELSKEVKKISDKNPFQGIIVANKVIEKLTSFFNSKLSFEEFFIKSNISYIDKISSDIYKILLYSKCKITHGFILKSFAEYYDFSTFDYEIVLMDEAQDINPVMLLILEKLNVKREVYVGDRRQSIFGFRDLVNIFDLYEKDSLKFSLSKSYRFGKEIGDFIEQTTSLAYKEKFNLYSNEEIDSVVLGSEVDRNYGLFSAYISRTNNSLLEVAFEEALIGTDISIPFEWEDIKQLLMDVFYLKIGKLNKIKNSSLKHLKSFSMLEEAIEQGYHKELSFLINIINNYNLSTLEYLKILEAHLSSPKFSELILITAHKSKGLEFLSVEIGEDFSPYIEEETSIEEKNLVYVAMSRAVKELRLNKDLASLKEKN